MSHATYVTPLYGAKACDKCGGRIILRRSARGSWYALDVLLDSGSREEVASGLHYGTCANARAARIRPAAVCPWCHDGIDCPHCGESGPTEVDRHGLAFHAPCAVTYREQWAELVAMSADSETPISAAVLAEGLARFTPQGTDGPERSPSIAE